MKKIIIVLSVLLISISSAFAGQVMSRGKGFSYVELDKGELNFHRTTYKEIIHKFFKKGSYIRLEYIEMKESNYSIVTTTYYNKNTVSKLDVSSEKGYILDIFINGQYLDYSDNGKKDYRIKSDEDSNIIIEIKK